MYASLVTDTAAIARRRKRRERTTAFTRPGLGRLRTGFRGELIVPGDDDYGCGLSGIMWLHQLHDHRLVAPASHGPRSLSNAQLNRTSTDYATALAGLVLLMELAEQVGHVASSRRNEPSSAVAAPLSDPSPARSGVARPAATVLT
jgi:hypothetical protein